MELERQGICCVDLTGQDYGLDLGAMLPMRPLTETEIMASTESDLASVTWEMSATYITIQIKNVKSPSLTTEHLRMWHTANLRRPGTCFVAFLNPDKVYLFDPDDISNLFYEATQGGNSSLNPFADGRSYGTTFCLPDDRGQLGRFLSCWGNVGDLLSQVDVFNTALKADRKFDESEANELLTSLLLMNHLEDDALQSAVDYLGTTAIEYEVAKLAELILPLCADPSTFDDDRLTSLVSEILRDNTWADSGGREKAFSRYNRALPYFIPEVLHELIRQYRLYMD